MPRLLIVDDERDIRFLLVLLFEGSGFDVDSAENGAVAVARLADERYDIVVLDVMMPVLDGWGVLANLADRTELPPIVMLTAHSTAGDRLRAFQMGATAFMDKPFDPDRLADLVTELASATPDEVVLRRQAEMEAAKRR